MHGSDRVPDLNIDCERAWGWRSKSNSLNESEMALFYERIPKCARKLLEPSTLSETPILRQSSTSPNPSCDMQLPFSVHSFCGDRFGSCFNDPVSPERGSASAMGASLLGGGRLARALGVVIDHLGLDVGFKLGHACVMIFFVISGY
jgi:hypothetical protein